MALNIILFLFNLIIGLQTAINVSEYSLLSIPTVSTVSISSEQIEQMQIAQFPFNRETRSNTRVSFNQQITYSLGALLRSQQAHFFELAEFADSYEQLGVDVSEPEFELVVESKEDIAVIYALPKKDYAVYKEWSGSSWEDTLEPLYSYVSAITYNQKNGIFNSILCVSTTLGKQEIEEPKIIKDQLACPQDTEELR